VKGVFSNALVLGLAVLVLCLVRLVNFVNKRLLSGGQILGGRIQPRGSNRFPLVATRESEVEKKRPALWSWNLIDLFLAVLALIWLLSSVHGW
jgi:hypothetical protein